ncbi:MAG: tetratricopeptide repeat protein [Desulfuromonadales bacterium]|nr:tetratricopeptide repeat protein [Desulfuromonadales bacterium]
MNQAQSGSSLIGKIGSYLQIISKDPSSTAFVPLAEAYRQTGLLDDALEAAKFGVSKLPQFSPGFATLGRILGQMGRIDEAMDAYAKALDIDSQSLSALVGMARLHLVRADRDQARKLLQDATGFHPDDQGIQDMLTALDLPRPWSEIQQQSVASSAAAVDSAVTDDDSHAEPIPTATLAEIYVRQGLLGKAITVYSEILRLNPENDEARRRLIQLQTAEQESLPAATQEQEPESQPLQQEAQSDEIVAEEVSSVPQEKSALAIFQGWLDVIKQRRAHV